MAPGTLKRIWNMFSVQIGSLSMASHVRHQMASREPLHLWLYRYLSVRLTLAIAALYLILATHFGTIRCESRSQMNEYMLDLLCLFDSIYVCENSSLMTMQYSSPACLRKEQFQLYYPYTLLILLGVYLINLTANLVHYKSRLYRLKMFNYSLYKCHPSKRFVGLLLDLGNLSKKGTSGSVTLSALYLFADVPPMFAISSTFYLLDLCFQGNFVNYGWMLVQYYLLARTDIPEPLAYMFPTVVHCDIDYIGSAGTTMRNTNLCILKLNFANRVTFAFLWFWFFFVFVLLAIAFLCKLLIIMPIAPLRNVMLMHTLKIKNHLDQDEKYELNLVQYILLMNIIEFADVQLARKTANLFRQHKHH